MPLVSVIVPVYKSENYVAECIESILAQTVSDFELILIDDGSPDNCGAICDQYATQDKRISVIHQSNGGVSSARNAGIRASKGDWLLFCDSDDTMPPQALESLLSVAADFPASQLVVGMKKGGTLWQPGVIDFSLTYNVQSELDRRNLVDIVLWGPWAKIVRGDIVRNNNIIFDTELCAGEDPLWNFFLVKHIDTIAYCGEVVYNYRSDNPNSANNASDKTRFYCSVLKVAQKAVGNLSNPPKYGEICFVLDYISVYQLMKQWDSIHDHKMVRQEIIQACSTILHSRSGFIAKYAAVYLTLPYWLISRKIFRKPFYNLPIRLFHYFCKRKGNL